ncbi:hypothetical protein ACFSKU_19330 [Pontibacter silvestris]|uniref:SPOR domain-containing protein n=1 Tax=Pontibacter silvestris TaxID=2305183 RepID=A0ABW4X242_9BACT|nr:hypothetical protein [Pontibacter silvestris]MCC9134959.1 hypothetical protein [Pontibacter silvestris]
MKRISIPFLSLLLVAFAFSSCRQETASPIKNVRFQPTDGDRIMDGSACVSYSYFKGADQKSLGSVYTKQILVSFADGVTYEQQQELIDAYSFLEGIKGQQSTSSAMLYELNLVDGMNCKQVEKALKDLAKDSKITYAAPYFLSDVNGSLQLLGVSNEATVTIKPGEYDNLKKLAVTYKLNVLKPIGADTYLVKVDKSSIGNALDIANTLKNEAGIIKAEPDFVVSL